MESGKKGYIVEDDTLLIERSLSDLDYFVRDFIKILKKYSRYLIVSGYISICTGRTRGTEDIDILVPLMERGKFIEFPAS